MGWTDGDALTVRAEQGKLLVEASASHTASANQQTPVVRVWSGRRVRICKTKLNLGALAADGVTVSITGSSLCIAARP